MLKTETLLAALLCVTVGWSSVPQVSRAADSSAASTLKQDAAHCLAHGGIDVCNDAIRRRPSDPQLLVALGDAEVRAQRLPYALRHYQRAAELAPSMRGLSKKINATEARLHPKKVAPPKKRDLKPVAAPLRHAPAVLPEAPAVGAAPKKDFSNEAPAAESH